MVQPFWLIILYSIPYLKINSQQRDLDSLSGTRSPNIRYSQYLPISLMMGNPLLYPFIESTSLAISHPSWQYCTLSAICNHLMSTYWDISAVFFYGEYQLIFRLQPPNSFKRRVKLNLNISAISCEMDRWIDRKQFQCGRWLLTEANRNNKRQQTITNFLWTARLPCTMDWKLC